VYHFRVEEQIDARPIDIFETPHVEDINAGILRVGAKFFVEHIDRLLEGMILAECLLWLSGGSQLQDVNDGGNEPGHYDDGNCDTHFDVEDHGSEFGTEKDLNLVPLHLQRSIAAGCQCLLGGRRVDWCAVAAFSTEAAETRPHGRWNLAAAHRSPLESVVEDHDGSAKHGHDENEVGRNHCRRKQAKSLGPTDWRGETAQEG